MSKYIADWKGFDRGREGLLDPNIWYGVLEILSNHEGSLISDQHSKMYADLEARFPEVEWISPFDVKHNFFRDYQTPWTNTGVLEPTRSTGNKIVLTKLGHALVEGQISLGAVWTNSMASYQEKSGERSFSILSAAFLKLSDRKLSLEQIYYGIERGWRPTDNFNPPVDNSIPSKFGVDDATPKRRLRAMLKLMVLCGALSYDGEFWKAKNNDILTAIADGMTLNITTLPSTSSVKEGSIISNSIENSIAELSEEEESLPGPIREKVLRSIAVRRGQPKFRKILLGLYNYKCAISGWDANAALEAAHIVPVSTTGSHDSSNGLILRADLHTLFDLHYIAINPANYNVTLSPTLAKTRYSKFEGKQISLPISIADHPSRSALSEHFSIFSK